MPEDPRDIYKRIQAITDNDGRLPVPIYVVMPQFPYEGQLDVKRIVEPRIPEPPRRGDDGPDECPRCQYLEEGGIWADEHWILAVEKEPTGLPVAVQVFPREHVDLGELDDERASELGRIVVHLERAIFGLGSIGRVHVARWGDTDAHLCVFVYARPEGFGEMRGTCLPLWEDILPPTPKDVWHYNHKKVAEVFAETYGSGKVLVAQDAVPDFGEVASRLEGI